MSVPQTNEEHVTKLADSPRGYRPECSCGWHGYETDRMSNDYAFTNAYEQAVAHKRKAAQSALEQGT